MKSLFLFLLLAASGLFSAAQKTTISNEQYRQDFNYFCTTINDEYCCFNKDQSNWNKVKEIYKPIVDTITTRQSFVAVLEKAYTEIYDHHAVLNTNTDSSRRLVPSGTDIWAEYVNGKPLITETRKGFGAETCGIQPGMEVIAVNDIPVETAIAPFLPRAQNPVIREAKSYGLRLLLAGNHVQPRKLTLKYQGGLKDYFPDNGGLLLEHIQYPAKIESKRIGDIGYIRINDCLYDDALIPVFDSVMQTLQNTRSLILDFCETPSGGNTSVARAILGWFITHDHFYQKHEYAAEEKSTGIKRSWMEIVSPRAGKYYGKPLALLCNHWTGSIAEGIIIGFDGLKRPNTTIIGTEMARLKGAVYSFEMPNSHIRFSFPAEKLYHIIGLPREQYRPAVFIDWKKKELTPGTDIFISKALEYLTSKK
jgi:C-terminal processing protease CtpA/Prc